MKIQGSRYLQFTYVLVFISNQWKYRFGDTYMIHWYSMRWLHFQLIPEESATIFVTILLYFYGDRFNVIQKWFQVLLNTSTSWDSLHLLSRNKFQQDSYLLQNKNNCRRIRLSKHVSSLLLSARLDDDIVSVIFPSIKKMWKWHVMSFLFFSIYLILSVPSLMEKKKFFIMMISFLFWKSDLSKFHFYNVTKFDNQVVLIIYPIKKYPKSCDRRYFDRWRRNHHDHKNLYYIYHIARVWLMSIYLFSFIHNSLHDNRFNQKWLYSTSRTRSSESYSYFDVPICDRILLCMCDMSLSWITTENMCFLFSWSS